ncbi:MAG: SDR family oxidoreductase [Candidatus Levyibacteriota bacterium]
MKILGTGLSGLVGSRIVELLKTSYNFESSVVDITDKENIQNKIKNSDAEIILHLAAKTNVDGCEEEKDLEKESEAWKINVSGTESVARASLESGKKLIYVSTDFVFDGEKDGPYIEEDVPNPVNFYAKTKYEGEKKVQEVCQDFLIVRIAYPYRANFERTDFMRAILGRLKDNKPIAGIVDHIFTPTFVDDVAVGLDVLIKNDARGIYHLAGGSSLSPHEASLKIAEVFNLDKSLISKTTRGEYFMGKARRPFKLALKNDRIEELGVSTRSFEEGLKAVKEQLKLT